MSTLTTYKIDKAIHPGETLAESLEFIGMTQRELALKTELTTKHIGDIINGKASITPESALKLEKVLGIKTSFWNNLEKNYHATLARIADSKKTEDDLKVLMAFKETYNELVKHKILKRTRWVKSNFLEIIKDLQVFFGFDSLRNYEKITFNEKHYAFRKYDRKNINEYTISAVLRIAEKRSEKIYTEIYDEKKLREVLKKIKTISFDEQLEKNIPKIIKLLATAGISLICLPGFKNTHIQGATKWLGKNKAMILLKTTKQGSDRFWFNLLHEIGHILKHGKKQTFLDLEDKINSDEEREADKFASDFFMKGFVAKDIEVYKTPGANNIDARAVVKGLSKKYGIAKSIVAGRLSHEFKNRENIYKVLNNFIQRINYNSLTIN
jgi:HTH-type transcriptional regulator/antitoxin HigA